MSACESRSIKKNPPLTSGNKSIVSSTVKVFLYWQSTAARPPSFTTNMMTYLEEYLLV